MESKDYKILYLKYKTKYNNLKIQLGGNRLKINIIRQGNIDHVDNLHIIGYLQTLILAFPLAMDKEFMIPETVKIANTTAELTTSRKSTKSKPWNYLIWRGLMLAGYDIGFDQSIISRYYDFGKEQHMMDDMALQLSMIPLWPEYALNILLNYRSDPRKKEYMSKLSSDSKEIIDLSKFYIGNKEYLNPELYSSYRS